MTVVTLPRCGQITDLRRLFSLVSLRDSYSWMAVKARLSSEKNVMKHNNNKYAIIFDLVQVEDAVVF